MPFLPPDSTTPAYLPFILLNSIYEGSNAVNLTATDDSASPAITLPTNFPFGDTNRTRAYVSFDSPKVYTSEYFYHHFLKVGTNGYTTFGTTAYTEYRNSDFPGTSGQYITAGFWDDINIANGGFITYEVIESGAFLDSVNAYIKRKRPTSFEGTWMLVASYEKVAPFSGTGEVC